MGLHETQWRMAAKKVSMRFYLTGFFSVLSIVADVHATSIHVCKSPAQVPRSAVASTILKPDGDTLHEFISVASAVEGCRSLSLPVSPDNVIALQPIAADMAARLGDNPGLQGNRVGEQFLISEVLASADDPHPAVSPMPFSANLLRQLQPSVFGSEGRAQMTLDDNGLTLRCAVGSRPAGIILRGPWFLPLAQLSMEINARGQGTFEVAVVDSRRAINEAPLALAPLVAELDSHLHTFALPMRGLDRHAWHGWTIACPVNAARLTIDQLQLVPMPAEMPARSSWVWSANTWIDAPDEVLAHAEKYAIKTLFITVPLAADSVAEPVRLAKFIGLARSKGITVWAVDGDPHMVSDTAQAGGARRALAYVNFNRDAAPEARLGGMQFDVEPYLLPGFTLAVPEWEQQYLNFIRALSAVTGDLPLEMVVPYWWGEKADLLRTLAPFVAGLTVMDYRTDRAQIIRFAVPFLDWANSHNKKVRIALEAGPIADETQHRYARSLSGGELWQVKLGTQDFLLLLKQPRSNERGRVFRRTSSAQVSGSGTTFQADQARLMDLLPDLENVFSAWHGFGGMALHEID